MGRHLHATQMDTRMGIEGLGAPGGPKWSPIRKKHLQGVGLPSLALYEKTWNGARGSLANKRQTHQAPLVVCGQRGNRSSRALLGGWSPPMA